MTAWSPASGIRDVGARRALRLDPAPRWVECAYTPPYDGEDEGEDENWGVGGYDGPPGSSYADDDPIDVAAAGEGGAESAGEGSNDPDAEPEGDSLDEAWSCPEKPPELW